MAPADEQLRILTRGADSIYSVDELKKQLEKGRPLRVKLGMDPTAPDLTLGHSVVLGKLRHFQDCGHKAVLIIGDYTARIGDPTGRTKTRPPLSDEQIRQNAETYFNQAGHVLDLSEDKLEVRYNGEWLSKLDFADTIRLMSQMTTARMLERDTFAKRQAEGKEIYLHELLYPLMQAYDSVMVKADVELGGTDQTFNNLCGRDLQRHADQPPQVVLVTPILVGIDGVEKMSKSMGNFVALTDPPNDMFGKIMSIPDHLMQNWFELLTTADEAEVLRLTDPATTHPRKAKEQLAIDVITRYHDADAAGRAGEEFARVFGAQQGLPDDIETVQLDSALVDDGAVSPVDLVVACEFASTRGQARRLIAEKGIKLNGEPLTDPHAPLIIREGDLLQRGKRKFVRLGV